MIDFEAFWVPPGPDLELMAHLGLQGLILKHFGTSRARFGADAAFGSPGVDFEAFWLPPGPDLELMPHFGLRWLIYD